MTSFSEAEAVTYYNGLPKKRVATGVLVFNQKGEVLVLKPTYLDRWLYPEGGVELGESPVDAARRECSEEIGVLLDALWLAYINYSPPRPNGAHDVMQCMFTTDAVGGGFLDRITLQSEEVEDATFVSIDVLAKYVGEARAELVRTYIDRGRPRTGLYFEDGQCLSHE